MNPTLLIQRNLAGRLCAALLGLIGSFATVHAADIAEADVTSTLWPGGAPYTFFDTAAVGGGDYGAVTTATFDRSFGTLNVGSSGSQMVVRGLGWASAGTSFTATRVIATITYLGANGTNGGGDDVLIGKATNNVVANTTAGEWAWVFDAPITNTIDGLSNMFRITLTLDAGATGTMKFKTTSGTLASAVKLSVAGSTTAVGAGDPLARKWVGGVDGNWDTSTLNWSDNVNPAAYADGKNVTFDDTLSLSPFNNYITLAGIYSPSNLVVNNTAYDYHLSGGSLAGNMTLTKQGTNVFSLSMSNAYTGITTINAGTLEIDDANALGSISGGTVVNAGGSLALNNGITLAGEPLTLNGNGLANGNGALRVQDGANVVTVNSPITLGSTARIATVVPNAQLVINGPITDSGSNYTLQLNSGLGSGSSILLNSASNTVGNLSVYGYLSTVGTIRFGVDNVAPGALLTVGGGFFDLNGKNQIFAGLGDGSGDTSGVITNSSSTPVTLTIDYSGATANVLKTPITGAISLVKAGTGTQNFGGGSLVQHAYTGTSTINGGILSIASDLSNVTNQFIVNSGGTLRGIATYGGAVTVNPGGMFYAGYASNALGTVTVNNNLTLAGNTVVALNKDVSPSNDVVNVTGALVYGGTLTIYNIGTNAMVAGDSFTVFPSGGTGSFTVVGDAGPGLKYQFNDGVINVVNGTASYPTNITYQVSGSTLTLSWPETHLGWYAQSNSVSLSSPTDWHDLPGSETGTNAVITINPAKPQVFYRLSNTSQP